MGGANNTNDSASGEKSPFDIDVGPVGHTRQVNQTTAIFSDGVGVKASADLLSAAGRSAEALTQALRSVVCNWDLNAYVPIRLP
jgi:hypothetical protein